MKIIKFESEKNSSNYNDTICKGKLILQKAQPEY